MNKSVDCPSRTIEAHLVAENQRLQMLPKHFGRHMLSVEHAVYSFMRELAKAYSGGYWTYFELSNGGFYMAPQLEASFDITVDGNGFSGTLSADAAGITACLFAFSHLSFRISDQRLSDHFHALRDFALGHAESRLIFAAINLSGGPGRHAGARA